MEHIKRIKVKGNVFYEVAIVRDYPKWRLRSGFIGKGIVTDSGFISGTELLMFIRSNI